jgi:hypothetical protein
VALLHLAPPCATSVDTDLTVVIAAGSDIAPASGDDVLALFAVLILALFDVENLIFEPCF